MKAAVTWPSWLPATYEPWKEEWKPSVWRHTWTVCVLHHWTGSGRCRAKPWVSFSEPSGQSSSWVWLSSADGGYEVTSDITVPSGIVRANRTLGPGGATQYFIRDYSNKLRLIDKINLGRWNGN